MFVWIYNFQKLKEVMSIFHLFSFYGFHYEIPNFNVLICVTHGVNHRYVNYYFLNN